MADVGKWRMSASDMQIDWQSIERVLVVRLRSIGDTVLATPSLIALRRFLPTARIDILLEDWVAPLLDGSEHLDNVVSVGRSGPERFQIARQLRKTRYDVAFNLHGGTTSTFLTRATGARHRIGYANYRYAKLYTHSLSSSADFWKRSPTHSAEQQLALLGYAGIPVEDRPKSRLPINANAVESVVDRLERIGISGSAASFALMHPAAAFPTKRWPAANFGRAAEYLGSLGIATIAVASTDEAGILEELVSASKVPITTFNDLTLPETTALAARARIFIGNDSGIAHIAAAVKTPSVVIFGSSNRDHWRPWTDAPNELVFSEFACQPCPGYVCKEYGEPRCILSVPPEYVIKAMERLLPGTAHR
ncbi:glycosyltransferase family 9 protein [Leptolyngbya sp. 7M]|uniref:glycosyltransferase family 9 protein n=1 Tax=Leptolyngbya sp. 7M TaxID=2812896 RepID=UPI001B8BDF2F|nr:glycosyltransferase family 9 protein [Leptolyngbya sp. 7M]QYO61990.1 glycosyltransferase family 9 protein [Leptolyngbya sp. 7M]